jgi:hypothetical protein
VTGAVRDQVDEHDRINEVIVDDIVERTFDVGKFHMREVIRDHQEDGERPADPHQKAGDRERPMSKWPHFTKKSVYGKIAGFANVAKKSWKVTT